MSFILNKYNKNHIPLDCDSILLQDASQLFFLCTFLQSNTTVKEIKLQGNRIGKKGAEAIAKALKVNRTVTDLCLSCNRIGDQGAKAIAEALKVNCVIKYLDISENQIEDEGTKAIAKALKENFTIVNLNLSFNPDWCKKEGMPDCVKELRVNRAISGELKPIVLYTKCKTMALGLIQKVPIYVLLDIYELVVFLDLESKTNSDKFYNNNSFLKLLESKVSKKGLLSMMDKLKVEQKWHFKKSKTIIII